MEWQYHYHTYHVVGLRERFLALENNKRDKLPLQTIGKRKRPRDVDEDEDNEDEAATTWMGRYCRPFSKGQASAPIPASSWGIISNTPALLRAAQRSKASPPTWMTLFARRLSARLMAETPDKLCAIVWWRGSIPCRLWRSG
jgi:hypothetical protein